MGSESSPTTSKRMLVLGLSVAAVLILSTVAVLLTFIAFENEPEPLRPLSIGLAEKVDSLNPCIGLSHSSMIFYGLVYDCLQSVGNDMESEPNLAVDWSIVDDIGPYGSVWEYTLTQNAVWHDGVPFDARDVVFTLNLMAGNYSTIPMYHPYTYFIHHAEFVDNGTVRVHFFDRDTGEPIPVAFGDSLFIPILPRHLLVDATATYIGFTWQGAQSSSDPPLVGTGPFMVTSDIFGEWQEGDEITLVRNPNHHWAIDREMEVGIEGIELYFYDDDLALSIALENHCVDVASLSPQAITTLRDKIDEGIYDSIEICDDLTCTNRLLAMTFGNYRGASSPLVDDIVVRRALSMAMNNSEVIEDAYLGLACEGSTLVSPVNQEMRYEVTEAEAIGYDPAGAAQLLEENGYEFTDESPDVRVATNESAPVRNGWVPENTSLELTIAVLQGDLHLNAVADLARFAWEGIGVGVNIVYQTATYWPVEPITPLEYDIQLTDRIMSHPDPAYMLYSCSNLAADEWFSYGCSNETYDQHFLDSVTRLDATERAQSIKDCQRIHYLDVGAIVLAYPYQTYAWRTDTFSGWGDWSANPGRSIDAFWGGNPLYFDIVSIPSSTDAASLSWTEPIISRTRP